mgnify:CR=1 FL=1
MPIARPEPATNVPPRVESAGQSMHQQRRALHLQRQRVEQHVLTRRVVVLTVRAETIETGKASIAAHESDVTRPALDRRLGDLELGWTDTINLLRGSADEIERLRSELVTANHRVAGLTETLAKDRDFAQVTIRQLDVDELYVIPWEET